MKTFVSCLERNAQFRYHLTSATRREHWALAAALRGFNKVTPSVLSADTWPKDDLTQVSPRRGFAWHGEPASGTTRTLRGLALGWSILLGT